jgi:hypothetical protein
MKEIDKKIDCIRRVIINCKNHIDFGDPKRVYSQYLRYSLDEVLHINFCTSKNANGLKRKDVVYEHVVPHSIVMEKLLSIDPLTNENILKVLRKFYIICAITKEEDRLLNAAKLKSKMPDGWNEETGSFFARYEAVGISIIEDYER